MERVNLLLLPREKTTDLGEGRGMRETLTPHATFCFRSRNPFRNARLDLKESPPGNLPCLDVLRSAAILLVLNLHVGEFFSSRVRNLPFVFYGWSGVDLFFVLSGFLIGEQLWKEL